MDFIKVLLAALNAIPVLDKWLQQATLAYIKMQKEKDNAEFLAALETARKTQDVEALAANIGRKL